MRKKRKMAVRRIAVAQKFSEVVLVNPRVARALFESANHARQQAGGKPFHLRSRAEALIAMVLDQMVRKTARYIADVQNVSGGVQTTKPIVDLSMYCAGLAPRPECKLTASDFADVLMKRAVVVQPSTTSTA